MTVDRPNIVYLISDQLKPEATSVYGNPVAHTPNLQRLAEEGVVFDHCYANSALCGPCRQSLYAGVYPFAHPAWAGANCGRIPGLTYMGDHLREAGYETVSVGRLHGIPEDCDFGFESVYHYWDQTDFPFNDYRKWFTERIAEHPDREAVLAGLGRPAHDRMLGDNTFMPQELSQEAWQIERTEQFLADRDEGRPFFLHLGLLYPHLPWHTKRSPEHVYDPAAIPPPPGLEPCDPSRNPVRRAVAEVVKADATEAYGDYSDREWQQCAANYYGAVGHIDTFVGRLLDLLTEAGLRDNTIVVVTSDHSEMLGQFGLPQKQCLFDGAIHIPLIVWGAGVPEGQRRDALCEQVDFLPTFLDWAGADAPDYVEGISLRQAVASSSAPIKEAVHAWLFWRGVVQAMVRTRRHKLYHCRVPGEAADADTFELFDLTADPHEMTNLFGEAGGPEIEALKRRFGDFFWGHAGMVGCGPDVRKTLGLPRIM